MNKIIMHIDMNAYFASVEQQANPFLRNKPIGIIGKNEKRSVISAASYQAKQLGVKTAMSTWQAKNICPSIILYPGDPDKYKYVMNKFNNIFSEFTDKIEIFSIDESFLDITDTAEDYFGAIFLAQTIRERLKEELGDYITASIGISSNKLMSKLSSEKVKPNGITVTRPKNIKKVLFSSELEDLCGLGKNTKHKLNEMGIYNFEQLSKTPLWTLKKEFKSKGLWLYNSSNGIKNDADIEPENNSEQKSISNTNTMQIDTLDEKILKQNLSKLSEKTAYKLRSINATSKTLVQKIRFDDFSNFTHQITLNKGTNDGIIIFKNTWNMLSKKINNSKKIRQIGISAKSLLTGQCQQSIFKKDRKNESALNALDSLQKKYGKNTWKRALINSTQLSTVSSGFYHK